MQLQAKSRRGCVTGTLYSKMHQTKSLSFKET